MPVRILHGSQPSWSIAALACLSLCCHDGQHQALAADKTTLPEFLVRSWDNTDGLPSAPVRAIARTPDGYLWVALRKG
jgi:ligand-binding sensor domain-containing protein